jgi:glycosyltransferase involved in cell wall biosynthesis
VKKTNTIIPSFRFNMENKALSGEHKPVVSIITVVYNSEAFIEKTILSIINQTYQNIEYIIIDGGSTDRTIEIIQKYGKSITRWISQKDKGLYDAMNKGLQMARGDYVWFINSGDEVYDKKTVETVFDIMPGFPDIIYGETEIIDQAGKQLGMRRHSVPDVLNWKSFRWGMLVCHQSVLVKRELAGDYDLKFRHSSDFEWVIRAMQKSNTRYNTMQTLSKFMEGGQTQKYLLKGLHERFVIMAKYYGLVPTTFRHFILAFRLVFFYLKNKRF